MFWPPLIQPPLYLLYQLQLCQGWLSPTSKLQLNPEPGQCGVLMKAYCREAHSGPLDTLVQYVGWIMQGVGLGSPIAPRSLGEMKDLQISCQSHLLTQRCLFTVTGDSFLSLLVSDSFWKIITKPQQERVLFSLSWFLCLYSSSPQKGGCFIMKVLLLKVASLVA